MYFIVRKRGGTAQYSIQLANALSNYISLILIAPDSEEVRKLVDDDITVYTYETPSAASRIGKLREKADIMRMFHRELREIDPDLIHVPFVANRYSFLILPVLRLYQRSVVGTLHDPIPHTGHKMLLGNIDLRMHARIFFSRFLTVCFVHGPDCKRQAITAGYPKHKLVTVPHGLYTHFSDDGPETREKPRYDLLLFGNIRPNKGYDRMPEILDIVTETYPDLSVLVAGSPSSDISSGQSVEQTMTALREYENITLRDEYVPNKEVATLFRDARITVLPYYDATASGVLMSAYTFGTPVVVTDTGEIGSMVRTDGTGIVAEENSVEGIADAILELLDDPDRLERIADQIRAVRTKYEWDSIAKDTIGVYKGLIIEPTTP